MSAVAINPRHVAAVKLGVGRGARHHIILSSGREMQVSYACAARIFDGLQNKWDRIAPIPWRIAKTKPKRRARK